MKNPDTNTVETAFPPPLASASPSPQDPFAYTPTYRDPETGKLVTGADKDGKPIFLEEKKKEA